MNVYYSPDGNIEIHNLRPEGYLTVDEWDLQQPKESQITIASIKKQLKIIDDKSIRPLRAIVRGKPSPEEIDYLDDLGRQAEILRTELEVLTSDDGGAKWLMK